MKKLVSILAVGSLLIGLAIASLNQQSQPQSTDNKKAATSKESKKKEAASCEKAADGCCSKKNDSNTKSECPMAQEK